MILALVSVVVQVFLVIYLSYVVVEGLTFSAGDCAVRSLKWFNFWDRIPGVVPKLVQAKLNKTQCDSRGNKYTHHIYLKLDLFGVVGIPVEPGAGCLPINPMWDILGGEDDPDHLEDPTVVNRSKVLLELTEAQMDRLG